ncbi:MAG: hypothetical protein J0L92_22270 [Deltaproteobacteria bacterium]|nr:hypothetical protein [Deltaproteobacteria bacterium]
MHRSIAAGLSFSSLALALAGCPSDPVGNDSGTGGNDTGGSTEDAPSMQRCPTTGVPSPEEQMLPCCYRHSQADQQDTPEMRLRFIQIDEPAMSPLASTAVESVLNNGLQEETFNWLFRTTGADGDGPIEISTGYGIRNGDGTYTLGSTEYPALTLPGTLTGETVATETVLGPLDIPVFDETGTTLQLVLRLRSVRVIEANLTDSRNCIGTRRGNAFTTDASLEGYVTVADARMGMINVPPIMSTLCSVIAGELATPAGMMPLCDRPQSEWDAQPDSMCDADGCETNPAGATSVCDPATTCNAWRLLANFAAVGIDIAE